MSSIKGATGKREDGPPSNVCNGSDLDLAPPLKLTPRPRPTDETGIEVIAT